MLRHVKSYRIWWICFLGIGFAFCGGVSGAWGQRQGRDNDAPLKLKSFVVMDDMLKQPACTYLIPSEWKGEGKIFWRPNPVYPATGAFAANKPGSVEQIVTYPHVPFVDGVREMSADLARIAGPDAVKFAVSAFPEGGDYMGNEVRIAMTPEKYVEEVMIKRFRKDITSYKVIKTERMPDWAKSSVTAADAVPGFPVKTAAARVRVEYKLDGKTIHEDFFVLMASMNILKCDYWGAENSSSVRAEAGQLDKLHPLHQTVVHSLKIDEKWFARYVQASQMLQEAVRTQQKHNMEIHRIITETNNHVSKTISDAYWARQASQDKMHHQFSNYIRGVEDYVVPGHTYPVSLPSGYNQVWSNGLGEYVLSNNPNFNPNQQFNGNWSEVKVKK